MDFLAASRLLAKLAAIAGSPPLPVQQVAEESPKHGLEGRLRNPAAVGVKMQQTQGPRNYAPRLGKPV